MTENTKRENLKALCSEVRNLCKEKAFDRCYTLICKAIGDFPDEAIPHNLLGIVLEKTGDRLNAMKHFRAAWALDPAYRPANHNLHVLGTFFSKEDCAFDESDLPKKGGSTENLYNSIDNL